MQKINNNYLMSKGLLFFCCSCCILVLTIINLSIGPVISKAVGGGIDNPSHSNPIPFTLWDALKKPWGTANCKALKDAYDDVDPPTDENKKFFETQIDYCTRAKGMHDMEYTAFIFDIVIGFICGLIGLLHLFDLKKDFVSNTGLIGLICGIIGFALTFVYVILNGIVFTGQYSGVYERDGDGAFAEKQSDGSYKCLYGDTSGDTFSGIAKISDLNKKQYNYKHDFYSNDITQNCYDSGGNIIEACSIAEKILSSNTVLNAIGGNCDKIYAQEITSITNKDIFDRFLASLILSLIVCLANIGLALFGFLLFRTPGDF